MLEAAHEHCQYKKFEYLITKRDNSFVFLNFYNTSRNSAKNYKCYILSNEYTFDLILNSDLNKVILLLLSNK